MKQHFAGDDEEGRSGFYGLLRGDEGAAIGAAWLEARVEADALMCGLVQ